MVAPSAILFLAACTGASIGLRPAAASPAPPGVPARATTLFVAAAQVPGALASLPARARGQATPATRIEGRQAQLAFNYFAWYDAASARIWSTNCLSLGGTHGPVVAFPAGARGNVPPAVSIGGSATGLSGCQTGIALDSLGDVFVADIQTSARYPGGQVAIFGSGQRGDAVPMRRISGASANFHSPTGVAVDGSGNLYVADSCQGYTCAGDVQIFAPGANGNVASVRTIAGVATGIASPQGVALDPAGNIYVANNATNTITVYAPNASGDARPARTIRGSNTRLDEPTGLAVDGLGYLYVGTGDATQDPGTHLPVLVFGPSAKGNAAPEAAITIESHQFAVPSGVALR